ncbi:MAG: leucine-rich repeat protein, partial [Clostridia bacterium]|nr:leucine-rich repeat protein [Clostridia bacterium]
MKKSVLFFMIKKIALFSVFALTMSACVSCGGEETVESSSTPESSKPTFTVRDDNNLIADESALEEGKYTDGEFVYYISNNNASVVGYIGDKKAVEIPPSVDDIPVTSIGDNGFADVTTIESIKVPSSITNIGSFAFSYCTGLKSIELPQN